LSERYAGWNGELGKRISAGASLDDLAQLVHAQGLSPQARSGHQERLENIVNQYV
jgi:xylose isomerase